MLIIFMKKKAVPKKHVVYKMFAGDERMECPF